MHIRKVSAFTQRAVIAALFYGAIVFPAYATNKVSSPDVTKGRVEFEYRGGYDWDEDFRRDRLDQHKFVVNYGMTDRWRTEVRSNLADSPAGRDWTFLEWSNRFQINKDGSVWPKFSIQENYKFSLQDGVADRLEGTLLLSKDIGKYAHVANVSLETQVGAHSVPGTNVNMGWRTKYKRQAALEPGVEFYADFGKLIGPAPVGDKKYSAGPVLYGALPDNIKYELGFLFGLSSAAPDGRLKAILTYGF